MLVLILWYVFIVFLSVAMFACLVALSCVALLGFAPVAQLITQAKDITRNREQAENPDSVNVGLLAAHAAQKSAALAQEVCKPILSPSLHARFAESLVWPITGHHFAIAGHAIRRL